MCGVWDVSEGMPDEKLTGFKLKVKTHCNYLIPRSH